LHEAAGATQVIALDWGTVAISRTAGTAVGDWLANKSFVPVGLRTLSELQNRQSVYAINSNNTIQSGLGLGVVQQTIGSPRIISMSLHLLFQQLCSPEKRCKGPRRTPRPFASRKLLTLDFVHQHTRHIDVRPGVRHKQHPSFRDEVRCLATVGWKARNFCVGVRRVLMVDA
jgi:hypothetical protein